MGEPILACPNCVSPNVTHATKATLIPAANQDAPILITSARIREIGVKAWGMGVQTYGPGREDGVLSPDNNTLQTNRRTDEQ